MSYFSYFFLFLFLFFLFFLRKEGRGKQREREELLNEREGRKRAGIDPDIYIYIYSFLLFYLFFPFFSLLPIGFFIDAFPLLSLWGLFSPFSYFLFLFPISSDAPHLLSLSFLPLFHRLYSNISIFWQLHPLLCSFFPLFPLVLPRGLFFLKRMVCYLFPFCFPTPLFSFPLLFLTSSSSSPTEFIPSI